ncbi:hypothetical protein FB45DRAFT_998046 [Roridomyces roridus]|uniref:F-box domain-containing protein n=1 Tax=Roridomyces roridus TaxID=1738132 RepID=A0AAD7FVW5_9AGAR|nr:hypothetical protein FB45DRAFT_998046 [Roridomyces roridus]
MHSPFTTKLGTNYSPNDAEISEIEDLLVVPLLRLKQLDDGIAELQTALGKLKQERDDLGTFVNAHKALISPVRRLPLDIVQEIFVACLPTHRNCVMTAKEAPVLLGRICSAWRAISLSTPRLWASLHVVEPTHRHRHILNDKVTQRLEVVKTWLDRSGQCPLSISVDGPSHFHDISAFTSLFLRQLLPFAARWEDIALVAPTPALQELCSLRETDVPMLKRVSFLHHHHQSPEGFDWDRLAILGGERISSFEVAGTVFKPVELHVRWSQLTAFSMSGDPWAISESITLSCDTILAVITMCPALQRCAVIIDDRRPDAEPTTAPFELANLHTLEVFCNGSVDSVFKHFLRRLSFPQLRTFNLRGNASFDGVWETQSVDVLGQFFSELTKLEQFSIDRAVFIERSLVEVLSKLPPTLHDLRIDNFPWGDPDDAILSILAPSLPPFPCPGLQSLTITNCRNMGDDAVVYFVATRMVLASQGSGSGGVTPLKRIRIKFQRPLERDVMPDLRPFIEGGLKVSIQHASSHQSSPWRGLSDLPNTRPRFPGQAGQDWYRSPCHPSILYRGRALPAFTQSSPWVKGGECVASDDFTRDDPKVGGGKVL